MSFFQFVTRILNLVSVDDFRILLSYLRCIFLLINQYFCIFLLVDKSVIFTYTVVKDVISLLEMEGLL